MSALSHPADVAQVLRRLLSEVEKGRIQSGRVSIVPRLTGAIAALEAMADQGRQR